MQDSFYYLSRQILAITDCILCWNQYLRIWILMFHWIPYMLCNQCCQHFSMLGANLHERGWRDGGGVALKDLLGAFCWCNYNSSGISLETWRISGSVRLPLAAIIVCHGSSKYPWQMSSGLSELKALAWLKYNAQNLEVVFLAPVA